MVAAKSSAGTRGLAVCGDAGDALSDDKGVDVVGAFIRFHSFEIAQMPHYRILVGDPVGAQQVAAEARAFESDRGVIPFEHGNMRGVEFARVFQASALQRKQLRFRDFGDHPGQLLLHELVACQRRLVELFAQHDVSAGGFLPIHRRSDDSPADPVPGLQETG